MKFTAATVATAVAVLATGVLAKPMFTNTVINPQEGEPFTLTFSGCTGGCTITLQTGPNSQALEDIRTLTTDATGGSFDVTLNNLGSGTYSFKITNNSDGSDPNYSTPFSYTGTGTTSSGSSSSMSPTASSSSGSSTESSSTDSSSGSSNTSSATSSSGSSSSTDSTTSTGSSSSSSASSTSSQSSSTTSAQPSSTSPSNAGSAAGFSPLGVIGAAAAALFL
ncbi:hypothetical protein LMH87_005116 [Akanthomyces muscarius]|uniref:Extracellular matrix protein n=1 Tax=Akanthomyces muscarius TaxID=2231603 RepID=A0A9W8QNI1_AKAMU|nr:hypothetical protein LMH87_005116 [Akanthomyces muscarius]KAJ4163382.1 hypothetical protein LMH87_005116 [Akanthomyces muscarius]